MLFERAIAMLLISITVAVFIFLAVINSKADAKNSTTSTTSVMEYESSTGFVIAPGYKKVIANCIACHSAKIVIQQGESRAGWLELIEWMQEEQGMWPLSQKDLDEILSYLSVNYGKNRPHFSGTTKF